MPRLVVAAFGVTVAVEAPEGFPLESVLDGLPPDYRRRRATTATNHGVTVTVDGPGFAVDPDGQPPHGPFTQAQALRVAQSGLELTVAEHAPGRYVVHAGAVAVDGRAIVLPGASMAGKSTLTLALVRAGATYLSDEFAVFDDEGRVHPYARPIAMRHGGQRHVDVSEAAQHDPVPVGLVASVRYDAQRGWDVTRLTSARALVALLGSSATAAARPTATLDALTRALAGTRALGGTRGDADEAVGKLIEALGTGVTDHA